MKKSDEQPSSATDETLSRAQDDAELDLAIVQLFADVAKGWKILVSLSPESLADVRELYRHGNLGELAIARLRRCFDGRGSY